MRALAISIVLLLTVSGSVHAADNVSNIDSLDGAFRAQYARARSQFLAASSPIILSIGGNIVLYRKGQREERPLFSHQWQVLKTVDHIPLAIYVALVNETDKPLTDERAQALAELRARTEAAKDEINQSGLAEKALARQNAVIEQSIEFIDQVLKNRSVSKSRLDAFASAMGPPTLENAYDAEVMELGAVDAAVHEWKNRMTPEEWSHLSVVVCDAHMPRQQEREMQYFSLLLHQSEEGHRLVFMENNSDEQKALDLLATHRLDEHIGSSFFHDPNRMHRDLLSDGARRYLQEHPPQP